MNTNDAKKYLREFARLGCIETTNHCRERMKLRGVTTQDIQNVLMWGEITKIEKGQESQTWVYRIKGIDLDGNELIFTGEIDQKHNTILCITVF
jgi:hypothetical protein